MEDDEGVECDTPLTDEDCIESADSETEDILIIIVSLTTKLVMNEEAQDSPVCVDAPKVETPSCRGGAGFFEDTEETPERDQAHE